MCGAGDFGAVVHDGKIYMAGGNTDCASLKTREFNLERNEWKMKAVVPFGWKKYGIAASANALYLSGGLSTGNISETFKRTTAIYFYIF